MATIPANQLKQGTIDVVNGLVITAPNRVLSQVALSFNNPTAYDITISITRNATGSTVQMYSLTLDAGDTMETGAYVLMPSDRITVTTSAAGTTYMASIGNSNYDPSQVGT